ncbi:DUF1361 domain-containing protein [Apilactobacillus sp. TMW 2.2459]|uniref:DUF1361 domain-containing protein n=1 Tax=Apilactobacillus xinyiensis TaxID=2841032 RepID=UPI00200F7C68|nr:DUF1361 domain-containing protein [Apilactobacillus xinyiensis]MCL0311511.1 DUF1361 domain-containing protein [Apilactobacillus xinyiensis]
MYKSTNWQIRIFFILWLIFLYFNIKQPFSFLLLNTLLGYIPIELSLELDNEHIKNSWLTWPIFMIWLVFYPNVPYLLTDLFHLEQLYPYVQGNLRLDSTMWFNYACLMITVIACLILGCYSLFKVTNTLAYKLNIKSKISKISILIILTFISSVGIFIGRFLRLHTVYIMLSPKVVIKQLLTMWSPAMIKFVIIMMIIQIFTCWIMVLIYQNIKNNK